MTVAWKLAQMKPEQDACRLGKLTSVIRRKGFKSTIHLIQKGYRGETNFNLIAVPLLFKDLKFASYPKILMQIYDINGLFLDYVNSTIDCSLNCFQIFRLSIHLSVL